MRLSAKQKELALRLFGSDRLTRRQLNRGLEELKEASKAAFDEANQYDILALAESYATLKKDSQNWYSGPCPMSGCGGSDRFVVDIIDNKAWCRACNWQYNGLGGGPVGFIASLYNLSAFEARDYILGRQISVDLPKIEPVKPDIAPKKERVRVDFSDVMHEARHNLSSNNDLATWARSYFSNRGIGISALKHYGVGVTLQWGRAFVAMPFYSNADLILCGVGLRTLGTKKKKSIKGSIFQNVSFGLDTMQGHEIGVIVEGEVNALSIWQVLNEQGVPADVLSVGTESAFKHSIKHLVRSHFKQAKTLLIWADKEQIGHEARAIVESVRSDLAIGVLHSKEQIGQKGKIDANDLLLAGHLGAVLKHALPAVEPSADNTVTDNALISANEPIRAALSDADCIQAMNATLTVTLGSAKVEQGHEARLELLLLCSHETERIGTQEANVMYSQAESLFELGSITALFDHVEQMRAIKTAQKRDFDKVKVLKTEKRRDFEQNKLFGQSELDNDRSIASSAIETAHNREFTNALVMAKQIKDSQLRRRTIGQIRQLKKAA